MDPAILPEDKAFSIGVIAGDATPSRSSYDPLYRHRRAHCAHLGRDAAGPEDLVHRSRHRAQLAASEASYTADNQRLGPDRTYRYAFVSADGNTRSPIGSFRHRRPKDTLRTVTFARDVFATARDAFRSASWRTPRSTPSRVLRAQRRSGLLDAVRRARRSPRSTPRLTAKSGMRAAHEAFTWYATWRRPRVRPELQPRDLPKERFDAALGAY